ncbi:hypothetical protein M0804_001243 [Polistes exclamans]|nr:hypothetical protein M0804_001243 [Polistes exclamans]
MLKVVVHSSAKVARVPFLDTAFRGSSYRSNWSVKLYAHVRKLLVERSNRNDDDDDNDDNEIGPRKKQGKKESKRERLRGLLLSGKEMLALTTPTHCKRSPQGHYGGNALKKETRNQMDFTEKDVKIRNMARQLVVQSESGRIISLCREAFIKPAYGVDADDNDEDGDEKSGGGV